MTTNCDEIGSGRAVVKVSDPDGLSVWIILFVLHMPLSAKPTGHKIGKFRIFRRGASRCARDINRRIRCARDINRTM